MEKLCTKVSEAVVIRSQYKKGYLLVKYREVIRSVTSTHYSHKVSTAQRTKCTEYFVFDIRAAVLHSSPANYFYINYTTASPVTFQY